MRTEKTYLVENKNMTEINQFETNPQSGSKAKFIIGGVLIVAAIIYLIASSATANARRTW